MEICLLPIGSVDREILDFLRDRLKNVFGDCRILETKEIPFSAFNTARNQYNSTRILIEIEPVCDVVLGVTEVDIYADNLNFVFGEAEIDGRRALISLKRLRPEFYGLEPNYELLKIRTLKEAMHEIGHVLGLLHCRNKCVMRFSNSIVEVDYKDWKYCESCIQKLRKRGIILNI